MASSALIVDHVPCSTVACWHTDLIGLKALAENGAGHPTDWI